MNIDHNEEEEEKKRYNRTRKCLICKRIPVTLRRCNDCGEFFCPNHYDVRMKLCVTCVKQTRYKENI